MFAWKSMANNSSLVKLKLDMVYRDLSMETALARFTESTQVVQPVTEAAPKPKPKPVKRVVKVVTQDARPKLKRGGQR
jgi:hypothetical protein